jgi:hypothetical protein
MSQSFSVQELTDRMTTDELEKFTYSVVSKYGMRIDAKMNRIKQLVDMFSFHEQQIREALDALEREDREQS